MFEHGTIFMHVEGMPNSHLQVRLYFRYKLIEKINSSKFGGPSFYFYIE